jgi:paraquat-inducible protein B
MEAETINQAEQIAEKQKRLGAEQMDELAKAVHGAADELKQQMPKAADFVHGAASRLEQGAGALRDRSIGELMNSLNDVAHRNPLAMFGVAIVAGFAISRFLKSSADRSS